MTTRRLALLALALVHTACELTYPWSQTPPPPSDRERAEAASFTVVPATLDVTTPPGVTPPSARLRVTVSGLEGQAYLGIAFEGAAVTGAPMEPTVVGADVWVGLATAASVQDLQGSVTLSVCLDPQCTLPIRGSPKTVPVALHVRVPGLAATPASVELAWTRGTSAPAEALVVISETSGASALPANLSVLYDGPSTGWLSAALGAAGTVPGALALGLVPGALPAGTHTARVHVVAQGATLDVPVSAVVSEPGVVATPAAVAFAGVRGEPPDPLTASVALSAAGGGTLQVVQTALEYEGANTGWLHMETPPLQVPGQLAIWPISTDLPSGTHEATIRLTGLGGVELARVPVRYTVALPPNPVRADPATVALAAFVGQNLLPWHDVFLSTPFSEAIPFWVEVDYGAGPTGWLTRPAGGTAPSSISLRVSRTDLAPGTYTATVRLVGAGGVALGAIPVAYELAEPRVIPAATTVSFLQMQLDSPPFRTSFVDLATGGDVPLAWETSIEYGAGASGWLSASASGTAPGGLTLGITRNDLPLGTYQATVHLRRPGSADDSTIAVSYELRGPYVTATPESLSFTGPAQASAPPAARTVTLASPDQAWTFTVGTRFAGDTWPWIEIVTAGAVPGTLTARPSTTNLPPGTYTGEITLHSAISGGLLGRIPISYTLTGPPLTTAPATVAFTVDQASGPGALQASLGLVDGGAPRTFSVVSKPSWLVVSPTAGSTATVASLDLTFDLASIGTFDFGIQDTLVIRSAPAGGGPSVDLPVTVTANVLLPAVRRVGPWIVAAGDLTPVVVRGRGLEQVAPGTLVIGGTPVAGLTPVSWQEATVNPPALPPGRHAVTVTNGLGLDTGHAELVVVPVAAAASASGPSRAGTRTAVIRDDARGAVYAANTAGYVERWRDANGLALESLALPAVQHLALTPDGARLVAVTATAVWELDPEAFVLPASPRFDLSWLAPLGYDFRIGFTNDGNGVLANVGPAERSAYLFDWQQGTMQADYSSYRSRSGGVAAARDGSRVLVASTGSAPFYVARGAFNSYFDVAVNPPAERPAVDRTASRLLPSTVGAPQLFDRDHQPIAGTLGAGTVAALLSDAGTRAFTVDGDGRVHVWDVSAPVAGGGTYPEVGTPGGFLPAVSPGANVRFALSVDERTLYVVGDDALVVVPLGP